MTYAKPGYYELPVGKLLPAWCDEIKSGANWESSLSDTIDNLGRGGRRVASIGLEDIVALKGEGLYARGTSAHRALTHLLCRFLHTLGVLDRYPRIIGYRTSPYLELDECVDQMMSSYIKFPSFDSLGGATSFNLEALKGILPTIVREIAFLQNLRPIFVSRLRLKLGSIAFKIATGQAITQAERSFYVAYSSPDEEMGWTREEKRLNKMGAKTSGRPSIAVADSGDPLVREAWDLFVASTEQGPYLRFMTMQSNTNMENLVYWYGPQQAALSYGMGYVFGYGSYFVEPRVKEGIVLPWSPADQLTAVRERSVAFSVSDSSAVFHTPVIGTLHHKLPFDPTWDLPDVQIRVKLDGGSIAANEYSYWSNWRERVLSTRLNASPQTLLTDLALQKERLGDGQATGHAIQDWDLLDLDESRPYLGAAATFKPDYKEDITIPGDLFAVARQSKTEPVDMTDFYQRLGTTMFPPAFREFVMCPMAWLHVPDQDAEEYIAARLGLTWERKLQAMRTIRISHNYAKLKRLLSPQQLPITEGKLNNLCNALLGA